MCSLIEHIERDIRARQAEQETGDPQTSTGTGRPVAPHKRDVADGTS